jgi:hypothetical protein
VKALNSNLSTAKMKIKKANKKQKIYLLKVQVSCNKSFITSIATLKTKILDVPSYKDNTVLLEISHVLTCNETLLQTLLPRSRCDYLDQ